MRKNEPEAGKKKKKKKNQLMETRRWKLLRMILCGLVDSLMTWLDPDQEDAQLGPSTDSCMPTESGWARTRRLLERCAIGRLYLSCNHDRCKRSNQIKSNQKSCSTTVFQARQARVSILQYRGNIWYRARIFKLLRSPTIDSKVSIPPAYLAWRAGMTTQVLLGS